MIRVKHYTLALLTIALCACQGGNNLGTTGTGALTGGALGAGLGAIIGHETGNTGAGIAIGSAAGLLGGGLVGRGLEQQEQDLARRDQAIASQEEILAENRRLIEALRSRGADVRSTDRGVVVNLPDVLFEFDRANLTPAARETNRNISDVIRTVPDRNIYVEGHTDSVGTIPYNQRLSENRAWSVADDLVGNGVNKGQIYVKGFGESQPIASNSTEAGRKRNRRVEVIIGNN